PPYSSGQDSANDENANESYPTLDAAIRDTYAARSTATNKNSLYDSYIRAIKWASLRIADRGVIAFVTNGGWLDSNTADGMRLSLADEFSDIHVLNLRGNQRTAGEQSRKEGGKVFGGGSRATVAVTILVKDPNRPGPASIHYTDIGDYLSREQKLAKVAAERVTRIELATQISPNAHGDWLHQRSGDFDSWQPIGDKQSCSVFGLYSGGLKTNRDAWCYNASSEKLEANMRRLVGTYEADRQAHRTSHTASADPKRISWNRSLLADLDRGRSRHYNPAAARNGAYRPFTRQRAYFDRALNDMVYRLNELFPTRNHVNFGFALTGLASHFDFCLIAADSVPDLHLVDTGQFFARWRYEKAGADEGMLAFDAASDGEVIDGYRRIDNITDHALANFVAAYGDSITKDDIFHYVYGLLHSPDYRETYAADLKKMLPRIPLVTDPWPFVEAGRRLSELHLGYETVPRYPLEGLDDPAYPDAGSEAAYPFFRVEKMGFAKVRDPETKKLVPDKTTVVYNSRITLSGIPQEAYRYLLGSRSAVEWIIDRYQVKTDKPSGIVNDPNDWSREVRDPRYIIDLLARIVTVSLETMTIVDSLPDLEIRADT
ncbi:MAG: type ISP restriction/modification enzyme, partial [Saprospiraceae bacterium]